MARSYGDYRKTVQEWVTIVVKRWWISSFDRETSMHTWFDHDPYNDLETSAKLYFLQRFATACRHVARSSHTGEIPTRVRRNAAQWLRMIVPLERQMRGARRRLHHM